MKLNFKSVISLAAIAFAVSLSNYCTAAVYTAPSRVVISPPPAVPQVAVPGSYVWDGRQYVGMVGNQYYYLGPGNAWVIMDPARMNYFRGWARTHPNWRAHATRNTRYRTMGPVRQPVHTYPMTPPKPNQVPPPHVNPGRPAPGK